MSTSVITPRRSFVRRWAPLSVAATLVLLSGQAQARGCRAADNNDPDYATLPVCTAVTQVPEPSSPLLFVAAAGVAGLVFRLRK